MYNYKKRSFDVFKNYINYYLKQKIEAKGYPPTAKTTKEREAYISEVEQREGIILSRDNIKPNPGIYFMAKILLNSLWGKLCQNNNMKKCKTIYSDDEFDEIWANHKINVLDIFYLNYNSCLLNYEHKSQHATPIPSQNCIVGSFVAAYGRMRLYEALQIIGSENLMYTDTDSVIYCEENNEITEKLDRLFGLGPHLGQLDNELNPPTNYIETFIGLAPKSYAFRTSELNKEGLRECVKNKGFSLNIHNKNEPCSVDSFIEAFHDKDKIITSINKNFFVKNPYENSVYMKRLVKRMGFAYDKRYIINTVDTLPYGYNNAV